MPNSTHNGCGGVGGRMRPPLTFSLVVRYSRRIWDTPVQFPPLPDEEKGFGLRSPPAASGDCSLHWTIESFSSSLTQCLLNYLSTEKQVELERLRQSHIRLSQSPVARAPVFRSLYHVRQWGKLNCILPHPW